MKARRLIASCQTEPDAQLSSLGTECAAATSFQET